MATTKMSDRVIRKNVFDIFVQDFDPSQSELLMKVVVAAVYNSVPGVQRSHHVGEIVINAAKAAKKAALRGAKRNG